MEDESKKDTIERILDDVMAPEEAVKAYPDECANCGAPARPFFIPNDFHKNKGKYLEEGSTCTICTHDFFTGEETERTIEGDATRKILCKECDNWDEIFRRNDGETIECKWCGEEGKLNLEKEEIEGANIELHSPNLY